MAIPLRDLQTLSPEELGSKYTRKEWEETQKILQSIGSLSEYEAASKADPGKMSFLDPELWKTAASNIPSSAGQVISDVTNIPSALKTVATTDPRDTFKGVWEGLKGRYGSEEAIKRSIATDPVGVGMDIFPGTGGVARKLLGEGSRAGRFIGKLGDLNGTNKLISAGKAVGRDLPIWAASHATSALSGTDIGSLRNAWEQSMRGTPEAQRAFKESVYGTHSLDPEDALKKTTDEIQRQASDTRAFDENRIGLRRQSPTPSALRDEVLNPIMDILDQEDIQFNSKGRASSQAPIVEEPRGLASIEDAIDALNSAFDVNSAGVQPRTAARLLVARQRIDKIAQKVPDGSHTDRILTQIRGNIDGYLKQIPGMAEADLKYADSEDLIKGLNESLKKRSADSRSGALSKAVYEQSNAATKALTEAEKRTGIPLKAIAAGTDLSTTSPRGLVGKNALANLLLRGGAVGVGVGAATNPFLGVLAGGLGLALSNPKNVGRGIAKIGEKYQKIRPLHEATQSALSGPYMQMLLKTLLYTGTQTSRNRQGR